MDDRYKNRTKTDFHFLAEGTVSSGTQNFNILQSS